MEEQEVKTMDDFENLQEYAKKLEVENTKLSATSSLSAAAATQSKDGNLIYYQLETPEILLKLEKFYRGEYLTRDKKGNTDWHVPEDSGLIPLNNFGVNLLMETVTKYIDKNTLLSNYKEERVYEIMADIGDELTLVIFCNYEKMGMDTAFKKTKFRLIVTTTLHIIESSYRRALDGRTGEQINQSKIVTQSDSLGSRIPMASPSSSQQQKKWWTVFNPRKYGS